MAIEDEEIILPDSDEEVHSTGEISVPTEAEDEPVPSTEISTIGDGNVTVTDSTIDGSVITTTVIVDTSPKNEDDTSFACEICDTPLDASKYGKVICINCGKILFRRNPSLVLIEFKTLDVNEGKNYRKILSNINNKLKQKKYELAYKYCLDAEELAPSESTTWEYFALTILYKEWMVERKPTFEIIKNIKIQLEICKSYDIEDSKYEELAGFIANKLFFREKTRLNSIQPLKRKSDSHEFWKYNILAECYNCLKCFESCFKMYNDIRYLEEFVKELSKPFKWIVKDVEGNIKNMAWCGKIQAAEKRSTLIKEIKKYKPEFEAPEIELERFVILEEEEFDPNKIKIISFN